MAPLDEEGSRKAMTTMERVRAVRERRRRREIQLMVVVHEDDLRESARAGPDYLNAVSADPKLRAEASLDQRSGVGGSVTVARLRG
jgi:hypothetical protein